MVNTFYELSPCEVRKRRYILIEWIAHCQKSNSQNSNVAIDSEVAFGCGMLHNPTPQFHFKPIFGLEELKKEFVL